MGIPHPSSPAGESHSLPSFWWVSGLGRCQPSLAGNDPVLGGQAVGCTHSACPETWLPVALREGGLATGTPDWPQSGRLEKGLRLGRAGEWHGPFAALSPSNQAVPVEPQVWGHAKPSTTPATEPLLFECRAGDLAVDISFLPGDRSLLVGTASVWFSAVSRVPQQCLVHHNCSVNTC